MDVRHNLSWLEPAWETGHNEAIWADKSWAFYPLAQNAIAVTKSQGLESVNMNLKEINAYSR